MTPPSPATLGHLADRFGLPSRVARLCILELAYAGWITIDAPQHGDLTIRLNPEPQDPRPAQLLPIR